MLHRNCAGEVSLMLLLLWLLLLLVMLLLLIYLLLLVVLLLLLFELASKAVALTVTHSHFLQS